MVSSSKELKSSKDESSAIEQEYTVVSPPIGTKYHATSVNVKNRRLRRLSKAPKNQTFLGDAGMPKMFPVVDTNMIFKTSRMYLSTGFLTSSTIVETVMSVTMTLGTLPNTSDFTSLFDAYRFTGLEFWLVPRFITTTAIGLDPGRLVSITDYDGFAGTTVNEALEYPGALVSSGLCGHYRSCVPEALIYATSGNIILEQSPWVDIANTGLQHRGFALVISTTSSTQIYDLIVRAHLEFKRVR